MTDPTEQSTADQGLTTQNLQVRCKKHTEGANGKVAQQYSAQTNCGAQQSCCQISGRMGVLSKIHKIDPNAPQYEKA